MAKVMISIPDDLLAQVDARARQDGTTRSGLLQDLARRALSDHARSRAAEVDRLLAKVGQFDGRAAEHVRSDRDSR